MTENKVACPRCQAVLKAARKLPAGLKVQCPRCGNSFVVPGGEIAPAADHHLPGAAPAMGILEPVSLTTAVSPQTVLSSLPPAPPERSQPTLPSQLRRSWRKSFLNLLLILMGGGLLVGGGYFLVRFCFSEDKKEEGNNSQTWQIPEPEFKPSPPRPLIPLTKEEQSQVDGMVARGVAYLKKTQNAEGTWPGQRPIEYAALAGMTLLECGVPATDPVILKAADYVRKHCSNMGQTYGVALYLLFLNKLNDPQDMDRIQQLAMRLVMGQSAAGGWTYGCPILSPKDEEKLVELLRDLGRYAPKESRRKFPDCLKKLPPSLQHLAILQDPSRHNEAFFRQGGDNSNTQFGLLALWASRGRKLPVDRSLDLVVKRFRASQNADGSWNYSGHANASPGGLPTMTCAGLLGLAVGYGLGPGDKATSPEQDQAIQKAVKHLSKFIGGRAPANSKPPLPETYFLWSVERVGVLFQLKTIGDKEWYYWGMDILKANQNADGSWHARTGHGAGPLLDTCFALLFLQRANLAQDLTDKLREMMGGPVSMVEPGAPFRRESE